MVLVFYIGLQIYNDTSNTTFKEISKRQRQKKVNIKTHSCITRHHKCVFDFVLHYDECAYEDVAK